MLRPALRRVLLSVLLLSLVAPGAAAAGPTFPAATEVGATDLGISAADFPPRDRGYHTYPEMVDAIGRIADAHPGIVRLFSIGTSYQGRTLWAAEVSDDPGVDEGEPEVLLDGLHHGLEHMSGEMPLAILRWLTDGYPGDARVRTIVETRRIWIVFMVNPDGGQYDIAHGVYHDWRRNRQPTPGSASIGTDINRNYGYRWGCCGGSSANPATSRYRGPRAWSTPEARAIRDFVLSRVVDGRQRIRTAISFHTRGRLILYPYGYTSADVPRDMTRLDHAVLRAMAVHMAASNGYHPEQAGDLYISSGGRNDWLYGEQRVFAFTFEMTRASHPSDTRIAAETERNHEAVLELLELADCPYRALGAASAKQYCGPFFDDLEIDRGWRTDPAGTDTATAGAWSRGVPRGSTFQLRGAVSGQGVLVTGRAAGKDVDGGTTSVRSRAFRLPAHKAATLHLSWWAGLDAATGDADGLEIRLVDPDTGDRLATALQVRGDGTKHLPAWTDLDFAIPAELQGRDVAIELVATETSGGIVEAAIDGPRVSVP